MIFIRTDSTDIYFNLAAEYYLAAQKQFPEMVFMLWRTDPPALVCGRYQNVFQEIHMDHVQSKNYRIARRLSGGGTVYQDKNVFQYSFISPGEGAAIDFETYMRPMKEAMEELGVPVEFSSRNDLTLNGVKVSGTAQYHTAGYVVHHGTVLYDADLEELERCLNVDSEKIRSKGVKSVRERVMNIKAYANGAPVEDFMECLAGKITGAGPAVFIYELSVKDRAAIKALARSKFSAWEWIFGSSPECDMIKSGRVSGGRIEFHLSVSGGRIARCQIGGDFFCAKDVHLLEEALCDCRYEKKDLQKCLERANAGSFFYKMTGEELLNILV